jgi:hypothetical protein
MKKILAIAMLATLTAATSLVPAWSADTATDAAQMKLQSASLPALRQAIASAGGYALKSIELKHTAHQLTATIMNSKLAASVDREKEAIAMASAMETEMTGKPEFEGIASIHIDYSSHLEKKVKTIQIFDFFRSPTNAFVLHKT